MAALPSLRKGQAGIYTEITQPGAYRPQGEGNGAIQVVAGGKLEDGTIFQLEFREMGVKQVRLETAVANEAARKMLESCGFRTSTIEMLAEL